MAISQNDYGTTRSLRVSQAFLAVLFGSFVGAIATVWVAAGESGGLQGFITTIAESPERTPVSPFLWGFAATAIAEILYVFFVVEVRGVTMRDHLGLRWQSPDLQWAFGLAAAMLGFGYFIFSIVWPMVEVGAAGGVEAQYPSAFGNASEGERLLLIGTIGLLVPVAEELLFRGVALRAIEARVGSVLAVLGSSVLFSLAHVQFFSSADLPKLAFTFVAGLLFGSVTVLTGRLSSSIAAHAANNLVVSILATS